MKVIVPHVERRRADTSTRPIDRYERCHWPQGHPGYGPVGADVIVADIPLCAFHGPQRLAGILRGLPHADRYVAPWEPVAYEPVP